jgi:urease accessory protein
MEANISPLISRRASITTTAADLERAVGSVELKIKHEAGRHSIADLHQSGCGRLLFPARSFQAPLEAVIVNTAGGLTGGDRFDVKAHLKVGACAMLTTQACEKVYRTAGAATKVTTKITVDESATLHWLPQETILFDASSLQRSLQIDMHATADVLACESVILGRQAMGEVLSTARLQDSWRIRRDGRLVFAEETAVKGDWASAFTAKAALGSSTAALATLVHMAPHYLTPQADKVLEAVRGMMHYHDTDGGASVFDGVMVIRLLAPSGLAMRKVLIPLMEYCAGHGLPRVWTT